jgi:hypothetical protein
MRGCAEYITNILAYSMIEQKGRFAWQIQDLQRLYSSGLASGVLPSSLHAPLMRHEKLECQAALTPFLTPTPVNVGEHW